MHTFYIQIQVSTSKQSPFIYAHKLYIQAHIQTQRLLQRCDVVWLLCIAVISSALLLCSHPQTITGSQWTTSAREIPTKSARDIERGCKGEREREREKGGTVKGEQGGCWKKGDDEKVGRERWTKEDREI